MHFLKKKYHPKGFIIVLLTMSVLILSFSATLVFFSGAFSEIKSATYQANRLQAKYLAQSGLEAALLAINQLKQFGFFEDVERTYPIPFAGHIVQFKVEDLTGRLNINNLVNIFDDSINGRQRDIFNRLSEGLRISPDIWDGVIDWIDKNNTSEPYGYERSHYENLDPPRKIRNGPISSLEELLMIPGFTRNILFSDLRAEDEIELFEDSLESDEEKELFSSDQFILANNIIYELPSDPIGQRENININSAPYLVILSLHAEMTPQVALDIVRKRQELKVQGRSLDKAVLKTMPNMPDIFTSDDDSSSEDLNAIPFVYEGNLYRITTSAVVNSQVAQVVITYDKNNNNIIDYSE